MDGKQKWILPLLVVVLITCVCAAIACTILGGLAFSIINKSSQSESSATELPLVITIEGNQPIRVTRTPQAFMQTPEANVPTASQLPSEVATLTGFGPVDTLNIIKEEIVPMNEPSDLAQRLLGKANVPATQQEIPPLYDLGTSKIFWASNLDNNNYFKVQAILRYRTDHLYFWVEDGVNYNENDLENLCNTFENEIYPKNRQFFGSEWTPGVDNDPHLYVLYARDLGSSIGGYFSSSDEYLPEARDYSNTHEMFMINADTVSLGGDSIYGTMAHEFQHMIHWYQDRNEEVWVSEGLSTLSQLVNGFRVKGSDSVFINNPDLQLNTWPDTEDTFPHYGASFLFFTYFFDRFGEEAIKSVVSQPQDGLDGIDAVLLEQHATDPRSGLPVFAEDFFADWVVASYLNDPYAGDGRYRYQQYTQAPKPDITEEITRCSSEWEEREVKQFGTDYIQITCPGSSILKFEGPSEVGVVAEDAHSGNFAFWSNRGDESDMTLTRTFDLSTVSGPLTLQYYTWYDLEKDYDYLYLTASEDGTHWEILPTPSGTDTDPSGNSYGWGYTGESGSWIKESVDLSRFSGKKIQIRFEYVTDLAVNADGFLLDDVSIPEIQYAEDFETGDGGWEGDGFVRIQNVLPQTYAVSIIRSGAKSTVETVRLEAGQSVSIPLELGGNVQSAVLVVSGTTRYTTQPAQYKFRFEK